MILPHVIICCSQCGSYLWEMKILSVMGGKVGSTEYKPLGKGIPHFKSSITDCPVCKRQFFGVDEHGEHVYHVRDFKTGRLEVLR